MRDHTELPWEVNGSLIVRDPYSEVIADTDVSMNHPPKRYVTHATSRANRAFIVKACNCYYESLKALELTYIALLRHPHDSWRAQHQTTLATLRDAIAAATGKDAEEVQNEFEAVASTTTKEK